MFEDSCFFDFTDDLNFVASPTNPPKNYEKTEQHINVKHKENDKRKISFPDINPKIKLSNKFVERKFPGPAGLLPDNCDNINKSILELCQDTFDKPQNTDFLCSQKSFSEFENDPWQNMVSDFQDSQNDKLYEKFNVIWIKSNCSMKNHLVNYKAPFLAAVIDQLELTDGKMPTVKILLKDITGTIQGTILYSLYKEYSNAFTVGSVLVLIQFGVLSAQNSYCITITPNNLLSIYTSHIEKHNNTDLKRVEKISVQPYTIEYIWKKYHQSAACVSPKKEMIQTEVMNKNQLYNHPLKIGSLKSHEKFPFSRSDRTTRSISESLIQSSSQKNNSFKYSEKNQCFKDIESDQHLAESSEVTHEPEIKTETTSIAIGSSNILVQSDKVHSQIWKDVFQEVDTDVFFDDF